MTLQETCSSHMHAGNITLLQISITNVVVIPHHDKAAIPKGGEVFDNTVPCFGTWDNQNWGIHLRATREKRRKDERSLTERLYVFPCQVVGVAPGETCDLLEWTVCFSRWGGGRG
jgi:hypothetical protein